MNKLFVEICQRCSTSKSTFMGLFIFFRWLSQPFFRLFPKWSYTHPPTLDPLVVGKLYDVHAMSTPRRSGSNRYGPGDVHGRESCGTWEEFQGSKSLRGHLKLLIAFKCCRWYTLQRVILHILYISFVKHFSLNVQQNLPLEKNYKIMFHCCVTLLDLLAACCYKSSGHWPWPSSWSNGPTRTDGSKLPLWDHPRMITQPMANL